MWNVDGFSLAVLPRTTGSVGGVWEAAMKLLSTSVLAAIVGFGMIAASAPSAQETMTKEKLVGPGNSFLSKQLLVIRLAIRSENIRSGILKSLPPGIG